MRRHVALATSGTLLLLLFAVAFRSSQPAPVVVAAVASASSAASCPPPTLSLQPELLRHGPRGAPPPEQDLAVPAAWRDVVQPRAVHQCIADAINCSNDYDDGVDVDPGATVELVVPMSTAGRIREVCPLLETAVRMGYNITLVISDLARWKTIGNHEKIRLVDMLMRLRRAEILQELGLLARDMHLDATTLLAHVNATSHAEAVRTYLDSRPPHLFVESDAFDVVVQLPPRAVLRRWRAYWPATSRFIISGEASLFPYYLVDDPKYNATYALKPVDEPGKPLLLPFPNSGVWLGQLDAVADFHAEMLRASARKPRECRMFPRSDQCIAVVTLAARNMTSADNIDMSSRISQSMTPHHGFNTKRHVRACTDGRLRRTDVERTPVFVHFNGRGKSFMAAAHEHGWHRQPLADGKTMPLAQFHVAHEMLRRQLRVYDDAFELVRDAATFMMDLCTAPTPTPTPTAAAP